MLMRHKLQDVGEEVLLGWECHLDRRVREGGRVGLLCADSRVSRFALRRWKGGWWVHVVVSSCAEKKTYDLRQLAAAWCECRF